MFSQFYFQIASLQDNPKNNNVVNSLSILGDVEVIKV